MQEALSQSIVTIVQTQPVIYGVVTVLGMLAGGTVAYFALTLLSRLTRLGI